MILPSLTVKHYSLILYSRFWIYSEHDNNLLLIYLDTLDKCSDGLAFSVEIHSIEYYPHFFENSFSWLINKK